jgi:hypothetical protein
MLSMDQGQESNFRNWYASDLDFCILCLERSAKKEDNGRPLTGVSLSAFLLSGVCLYRYLSPLTPFCSLYICNTQILWLHWFRFLNIFVIRLRSKHIWLCYNLQVHNFKLILNLYLIEAAIRSMRTCKLSPKSKQK